MTNYNDADLVGFFTRIPREYRQLVKEEAARDEVSMGEVVTMALERHFKRPKMAAKKKERKW